MPIRSRLRGHGCLNSSEAKGRSAPQQILVIHSWIVFYRYQFMTNIKVSIQGKLNAVKQVETQTDNKSVSAIVTFSINENGHWIDLGYEPVIATDSEKYGDLATQLEGLANAVVKLSGFFTVNSRPQLGQYGLFAKRALRVQEIEVIREAKVPNTMAENTETVTPADEQAPEAAPKAKASAKK